MPYAGDFYLVYGGKDIFIKLHRSVEYKSDLPDERSIAAVTRYNFGDTPEPGYQTARICPPGHDIWGGCRNIAPCWHTQQLVSFADENNLYTFTTILLLYTFDIV